MITGMVACKSQTGNNQSPEAQLDHSQKSSENAYKPGLGELMGVIQTHHAKLWFAGQNQNWKLAAFEIEEIKDLFADINEYHSGRPETKPIELINPAIDSLTHAIQQQSFSEFASSYTLLTNSCNSCHMKTKYEFIVIKTPDSPPLSNQDFKAIQ